MRHLGWPAAFLAFTVLAAAATSAGRVIVGLLRGQRAHHGADLTHALMGANMAGMFVASLSFLSVAIWQEVFTVVIAWHAIRAIVGSQNRNSPRQGLLYQTGHLLSVAAMLYMLHASSATTGAMNAPDMPMPMASTSIPVSVYPQALSFLIAALLVAYAALVINQARRVARPNIPAETDSLPFAPRAAAAEAASEVVLCAAMAAMLVAPR